MIKPNDFFFIHQKYKIDLSRLLATINYLLFVPYFSTIGANKKIISIFFHNIQISSATIDDRYILYRLKCYIY